MYGAFRIRYKDGTLGKYFELCYDCLEKFEEKTSEFIEKGEKE